MANLTGFLKYPREPAPRQRARQRIQHWHEYEAVMPDNQAVRQAARCMDCGTPDCHGYCPVYNLIPEWNELVSEHDWRAAWHRLESTNNFPEFTGRICGAPCEDACTLSIGRSAVTIRSIELAIIERAWQSGWVQPQPCPRQLFKRVAIVGSGPAGLACAQQLARAGYRITVYEKSDRPGGLLRYGIPDFRLEKAVVERRLAQLRAEGVRFRTGIHVGVDVDFGELHRSSHAVVLACGAEQPRDLPLPGRSLAGIHFAMDYLRQQNRRVAGDAIHPDSVIDAADRTVVVIGGGDTGGDCIGTAIRQDARRVTQIQYHERPPRHVDNLLYWPRPLPEWHASDHDEEGCDHVWGYDTIVFEGSTGHVTGLVLQKLLWNRNGDGGWTKQHLPGQIQRIPAQLVLLALGYTHPVHAGLVSQVAPGFDTRGNIAATEADFRTRARGVFACGDARRGQSLVVWAIREGRRCARAVDQWLAGTSDLPEV